MEYNFTYREKDKGFQVILSYKDSIGRWKQKSKQGFSTKREAKAAGEKLLESVKGSLPIYVDESTTDITFAEFADTVMDDMRRNVTYNTLQSYRQALDAFAPLKQMRLLDIKHSDIIDIFNTLPYKATTANVYLAKIKFILKKAVSPYKLLRESPAAEIAPRKIKGQQKINALTKERLNSLLETIKGRNTTVYTICCIAAYAGLRIGEIMGLKWSDVDFTNTTIKVERQLVATGNNTMTLEALKSNNSYRTVPIPPPLVKVLKEYKHQPLHISGRIFGDVSYSGAKDRLRSYFDDVTMHDLRHTYATTLIANNVDVKTVAALLGDKVETVLSTYVHFTDDMRLSAADMVKKIF
ncbi:tyrosine-type recombinase/integrase [Phascolarctobacterium faecium]|uniref:site-specific integrase n=1 Tax=Phascolarctobacterium faecium TaxID=33025 RepID=UPI003AB3CC04